jgi:hypothetical protein
MVENRLALRRCVLAVAVLQDVDVVPTEDGVLTDSGRLIPWDAVAAGLAGCDPESPAARTALSAWLRAVQQLAWRSPSDLASRARPVGLPRGHLLHPGATWAMGTVPGGVLDVGVGFLGVGPDQDEVVVPRAGLLAAIGLDTRRWWPACAAYLEDMGLLAASRLELHPDRPLRPMGDCDVVTLLASRAFRRALSGRDWVGMRAAAVPTRQRGWLDLSRTDPAFALAAAALADPDDRGFPRPLLITAEELVMARAGGDPVLQAIRDGAAPDPILPAVLFR